MFLYLEPTSKILHMSYGISYIVVLRRLITNKSYDENLPLSTWATDEVKLFS